MSDSIFNRPRRPAEPRDERGRDLGAAPTANQGAADRRDPGADALLELARLIGQAEPFAPAPRASEARQPDGRVTEASVGTNSADRGSQDRVAFVRPPAREPALSQERPHEDRALGGRPAEDRAAGRPDLLQSSGRDEYPVAPRQGLAHDDYDDSDHDEDHPPVYGPDDEYAGEYSEDEHGHDGDYDYDDEHLDERESGSRRRGTTKIVMAIVGLAVLGSAGAFGYRTMFKATPSGPTPIIRADNSPTKVVPAGTDTPKQVNDRLGDGPGERLVRRDEDPVDVGAYRSVAGDGYRAGGSTDAGASGPFPDASAQPPTTVPASGAPTASSDAKRVRTVPIRTDQGTNPSAPDRMVVPERPVSTERPVPPDRTASRPAPPPPSSPPAPRSVAALAAPGASTTPAGASDPAPTRAVEGGGFVVQLSAQRSEADAQTSFRAMQAKYSSVLSGHQPLIRRKDQGDRGVFYAAQVGPFGAKSDADQLCEALKSAGGTCFVQKN